MAQLPSVLKFVFSDAVTGICIVAIIANLLFPMKDAADIAKDGKEHTINMLSEKCMCDSCLGVMKQFKDKYPNVTVNVVSNKKERAEKNHNKPWEKRKE